MAEVSFGARTKRGDAGYMGAPAVIISVEKQPDVDTVRLTKEIESALAELTKTLPRRHQGRQYPFSAGQLHPDLGRQRHQGAL